MTTSTDLAPASPGARPPMSAERYDAAPPARTEFDKILALVENPAVDMQRIDQAISLLQRVEAERARRAFEKAFAAAKAKFAPIIKTHEVSYGEGTKKTDYKHEDLADIEKAIAPALAEYGLSYRWQVSSDLNQPIKVTCIVTHEEGHFEETTLTAGRDDSGGKNAIQQVASSLTYLQRYTLRAAMGLAIGRDNDAKDHGKKKPAATGAVISAEQQIELQNLIADSKTDIAEFLEIGGLDCLSDMPASEFAGAKRMLLKRKLALNPTAKAGA